MDKPGVGVQVIIRRASGKWLMGKRLGSHGHDTWHFPGGKLEKFESLEFCAHREVLEETGIYIRNPIVIGATNDIWPEPVDKHFCTIWILADYYSGTPKAMEPDKCAEWVWTSGLIYPLFLPLMNFESQLLKILAKRV